MLAGDTGSIKMSAVILHTNMNIYKFTHIYTHAQIDIPVTFLPHIWYQKPNLRYLSVFGKQKNPNILPPQKTNKTRNPKQTSKTK